MNLLKYLEKNSSNNATVATINLFKQLQVPVTNTSIIETLEHHPDYPSLLSVSDTLKSWNVKNVAMKVPPENFTDIPTPFIAHTRKRTFIVVKSTKNNLQIVDDRGKTEVADPVEFNKNWDNVVLVAFPDERSGDAMFAPKKKAELINQARLPFIIAASIVLIVCRMWVSSFSITYSVLLLLKFAGSIITALLLWFDVDKNNPNLIRICSNQRKVNCSAVLSSKGARLFNFISWSEVGFFYFAGGTIFLLIFSANAYSSIAFLAVLNLIALPYTGYSVFYQWKIAKQWCKLCLLVQAILVLEFLTCCLAYLQTVSAFAISTGVFIFAAIAFLLPILFWIASKSSFLRVAEMKKSIKDLSKFKNNPETFIATLEKSKRVDANDDLGIILGNPKAQNTLLKVCNPFCGPCRKAHGKIESLINQTENIKVQIVFSGTTEDNFDKTNLLVDKLVSIYQNAPPSLLLTALGDWYIKNLSVEQFMERYSDFQSSERSQASMSQMRKWCLSTGIEFTPTYFYNNYQLPEVYSIEEIKNFL